MAVLGHHTAVGTAIHFRSFPLRWAQNYNSIEVGVKYKEKITLAEIGSRGGGGGGSSNIPGSVTKLFSSF